MLVKVGASILRGNGISWRSQRVESFTLWGVPKT
jgi:hypothetical protein